jgi:hypothetical protein
MIPWMRGAPASILTTLLGALSACHAPRDQPPPVVPPIAPAAAVPAEAEPPKPRSAGRYLISLDPWKTPVTWFCFNNLKNPADPSVCVQSEEECNVERSLKQKYSAANGVAFAGSACHRADDPHCTFMYVREGRAAPADTTGKRGVWSVSEKINTCCNYVCSETQAECDGQAAQLGSAVLREGDHEREQMSCDIPCRRWSTFPADHDRERPLVCQRNHE